MISSIFQIIGTLAARFAAFFFIWRWAKTDAKADRLEDENKTLRDTAGLPDSAIANRLRERAKAKDRN